MQDAFNPYAILDVNKDTSNEDIKKAFKEKSKKLHPDQGGDPEQFSNLKKAFDILINPEKKNLYDEYGLDNSLDIENEAKLVATQIVISTLDGLPDSYEVDKEISNIFLRCLKQLKEQENQAMKSRDKLRKILNNIQKKPTDDFLTGEIEKVIANYHKIMKQAQLNYMIHDSAYKMAQTYKFDITKITFNEEALKSNSVCSMVANMGMWGKPDNWE